MAAGMESWLGLGLVGGGRERDKVVVHLRKREVLDLEEVVASSLLGDSGGMQGAYRVPLVGEDSGIEKITDDSFLAK